MPRSAYGGRHELGQNFLHHRPTIQRIAALLDDTEGAILELGAGDGAITRAIAELGRPLTAIDIDEHRVDQLQRALPSARVQHADALKHPLNAPVVVGNIPFHITTPILRRLLHQGSWKHALLLTQWEVARKRAGIGGGTMMTAQAAPWFAFALHGRVPAHCFSPRPSVDGGMLGIERREAPLVPVGERAKYERFVRAVFSGRGGSFARIVQRAAGLSREHATRALGQARIDRASLPRDLSPEQWASLFSSGTAPR